MHSVSEQHGEEQDAHERRTPFWLLGGVRFLTLAALALWLGGIIFLGAIAAPAIFQVARGHGVAELGPRMVGAMVARFNGLTYGLGLLLLAGWGIEHWLRAVRHGYPRKLWWLQGACSAAMLGIALYLGFVLMPRLNRLQEQLPVPQIRAARAPASRPVSSATKSEFNRAHRSYTDLTMLVFWLGMGTLLSLALRTAPPEMGGPAAPPCPRARR